MNAELRQAVAELQLAETNFDNAAPEFIDIAVYNLTAAKLKVNSLFLIMKGGNRIERVRSEIKADN